MKYRGKCFEYLVLSGSQEWLGKKNKIFPLEAVHPGRKQKIQIDKKHPNFRLRKSQHKWVKEIAFVKHHQKQNHLLRFANLRRLEKMTNIFPKWWFFMVIYHGIESVQNHQLNKQNLVILGWIPSFATQSPGSRKDDYPKTGIFHARPRSQRRVVIRLPLALGQIEGLSNVEKSGRRSQILKLLLVPVFKNFNFFHGESYGVKTSSWPLRFAAVYLFGAWKKFQKYYPKWW